MFHHVWNYMQNRSAKEERERNLKQRSGFMDVHNVRMEKVSFLDSFV